MKKKVKLFSTIASLCLAVALMAFGVWAATTSAYTVTSKVQFAASDVYVDFTADGKVGADGATALGKCATNVNPFASYTEDGGVKTPSATADKTVTIADLELSTVNRGFAYKITVTNNGAEDVYVVIADNSVADANVEMTKEAKVGEGAYESGKTALTNGQTLVYTIVGNIKDVTKSAPDTTINVVLTVSKTAQA